MTRLGFVIVRQKGSHVFLQKGEYTTVVPLHNEIKKTTLKRIMKQANITLEALLENL